MITIFLAEDEVLLRRGIRESIDWEGNGYCYLGDARDGESAYPKIIKLKPDILITDVKMPFMDGLELSELVKKELPQLKIIILSGHDSFDYVQKGLQIGISDYLLKPITPDRLLKAIHKVAEKIRNEEEKSKLLERYFTSYEKYTEFLEQTNYMGVDRTIINRFLQLGSLSEVSGFVEEYFTAVGNNNYNSLLLRQYIAMDLFYCAKRFLTEIMTEKEDTELEMTDLKQLLKAINSVEETKNYIKELLAWVIEKRDANSVNRYHQLIFEAKRFIEENYGDPEFSLQVIANHTGISPSYFSSIFKAETGRTFIEYLTGIRIEKACELLKSTSLRSAEIAEKIGYSDSHYFSSTFKKVTGLTPKEYRHEK